MKATNSGTSEFDVGFLYLDVFESTGRRMGNAFVINRHVYCTVPTDELVQSAWSGEHYSRKYNLVH